MPVTVYEQPRGNKSVGSDGTVTSTRTFRVNTGNASHRPLWGITGVGINKYDADPDDPTLLAVSINSEVAEGQLGWFDVSVAYSNKPFDLGTTDPEADPGASDPVVQPNPTLRTPQIDWGSVSRVVPFTLDWTPINRRPLVNSAGQPYEGKEAEVKNDTIAFSFNLPSTVSIPNKQLTYKNTINHATFYVLGEPYPALSLRCNAWTGSLVFEADFGWYKQCKVELEFQQGGWKEDLLDCGTVALENVDGNYVPVKQKDVYGQPLDKPVKLDGEGKRLQPSTTPTPPDPYFVVDAGLPTVSVYSPFWLHKRENWTNIFAAV